MVWFDFSCRLCSIDANLAHIDFDDFKNEDLQNAFAFSLPSYVSIAELGLRQFVSMTTTRQQGFCNTQKIENLNQNVVLTHTIFSSNVTGANFLAFKRCQIVATVVASVQLWQEIFTNINK